MPKPKNGAGFWITVVALAVLVVAVLVGTATGTLTGSTNGIFVLAAALIALLFLVIEAIAQFAGASLLGTVIIGEDGRTSTSKTFVLMWTLLVGWALVALLIAGQLLQIEHCVNHGGDCSKDAIGFLQLGWHSFLHVGLETSYLVLLGIPAAAAVAGKAVTESKAASGTMPAPVTAADKALPARVMQVFSADDGSTDIADFQYVIFNLILATYFVSEVVRLTSVGLPPIPETLLGLTSVSAALYVAKKAATRTQPTITAVFPSFLLPGGTITITGNNLTDDPALGATRTPPKVMINGVDALAVAADNQIPDRIIATVPPGLNTSPTNSPIDGKVEVLSSLGFKTPVYPVTLGP